MILKINSTRGHTGSLLVCTTSVTYLLNRLCWLFVSSLSVSSIQGAWMLEEGEMERYPRQPEHGTQETNVISWKNHPKSHLQKNLVVK